MPGDGGKRCCLCDRDRTGGFRSAVIYFSYKTEQRICTRCEIHETGRKNYQRNLCDRSSGDHCTGTDVDYGLCDEPDPEIQSVCTDSVWFVL